MNNHSSNSIITNKNIPANWPSPLKEEAYWGYLGRLVKVIEPHTEADPVALLVQMIVLVGNVVGRSPYFKAEADRHGVNLFATMVGESAKGRKGTSWGYVVKLAEIIDPEWKINCLKSGLSSGEGLIWAIKDETESDDSNDSEKKDKRLLSEEAEFASILRVLSREGNTLSAILRNAWDGKDLSILTKQNPVSAREPHISIVGHITRHELVKYLRDNEAGNGFGNRFLWVCVRRNKLLPEGGNLDHDEFKFYAEYIKENIQKAKNIGELKRDERARELWISKYPKLSEGHLGLFGAVTGRAEAQVMRLASIYALVDGFTTISEEHLQAAIAIWEYCESSARYVFGESTGDKVADKILNEVKLSQDGITRTNIRDLFNKNESKTNIENALELLKSHNLIAKTKEPSVGKPIERWHYLRP